MHQIHLKIVSVPSDVNTVETYLFVADPNEDCGENCQNVHRWDQRDQPTFEDIILQRERHQNGQLRGADSCSSGLPVIQGETERC